MDEYGVIFDMDGVLADTLALHGKAEKRALASVGISIEIEEILDRFNGIHDDVWFQTLIDENNVSANLEELLEAKWKQVYAEAGEHGIPPIEGALPLLKSVERAGYRLALASGSPRHFIDFTLQQLGIADYFTSILSVEEVPLGKPAPDLFLKSAEDIGVEPKHCVVIEDARSGMLGAKETNMRCIGLVADVDGDYPADLLVTTLHDVTLKTIATLLTADK